MADMFGGPVGESAWLQDRARTLTAVGNFEQSLASKALMSAQTGKFNAEAEELRGMQEVMKGVMTPGPVGEGGQPSPAERRSMADLMDKAALGAMERGYVVKGQKLAEDASQIRQREASAKASATTAQLNQIKAVRENAELQGQLFGGVQSEQDWRRANALFTFQTGMPSPYEGVTYSPEVVTQIRDAALSEKEKADLEEKRLTRTSTEGYRVARLNQHETALRISKARQAVEEAAEARRQRETGGRAAAGTPTTEELSQVKRIIKLGGVETDKIGAESLNSTAFSIASRARELQQGNRALGRDQAIRQAYDEAKAAGDLNVERIGGTNLPLVGGVGGEQRFVRRDTRTQQIQLPPQAKAQLKEGIQTTFQNGQVWTMKDGKAERVR